MKKNILLLSISLFTIFTCRAQEETTKGILWSAARGLEYSIKAGVNIGGTSPLPLPEEIRSIKSYSPLLSINLEGSVSKWFDLHWGISTGIRLETKGMKTNARVRNYSLEMTDKDDGGYMKGRWTGFVKTKVNNTYLTIPMLANYKLSPRWKLMGGFFFSYMIDGEFSGTAYDGYLREEDPTGTKIYVDEAVYDFSDDLSRFQWGAELGAEWKAFKHLTVHSKLSWGFKDIFKSNFETITFGMYPIYLNVGFGYLF